MSMLQIHRSALTEIIVPYHSFLTQQAKCKRKLFGFVEGKDDPSYYQGHIQSIINNDEWEVVLIEAGFPKGNRDRVLLLLNAIDWNRFSSKQTTFFVDRDLSDFFPDQQIEKANLYITDYYSIENNIVSIYTLKRVLREMYNVNLLESEFEIIIKLFNEGLDLICKAVQKISCYYIALRKSGQSTSFGDIDISKIINIDNCEAKIVTNEELIEYLENKWHVCCSEIDLSEMEIEFNRYNENARCIRGKYLIWYFVKFINSFCGCCNNLIPSMDKPITGVRELTEQYAVIDLSARSKTPESLKTFITNTYQQYISENT